MRGVCFFMVVTLFFCSSSLLEAKENIEALPNMKAAFEENSGWIPVLQVNPEDYYEEYEILDASSILDPIKSPASFKSAKKTKQAPKH